MTIDTGEIKRRFPLHEVAARYGVELKRDGVEWRGCCPFHAETTPSFTIRPGRTGPQFHCFGCDAKGDVLQFVMRYEGVGLPEAARRLTGEQEPGRRPIEPREPHEPPPSVYAGWTPVVPVPADAPALVAGQRTPDLFNPKRNGVTSYTPEEVYPYHDSATGGVMGYVLRVPIKGKKITPLLMWCRHDDGREGWAHYPMPEPRPIYRQERLSMLPDKQVLVLEGEKCADAAWKPFSGLACIGWQGGGKSAAKTDWSPLRDRDVILWRDNDEPGRVTMERVAELIHEVGPRSIKWIEPPADLPDGWDVADAVNGYPGSAPWKRDRIRAFARDHIRTWTPPAPAPVARRELKQVEQLAPDSRPAEVADRADDNPSLRRTGNVIHLPNAPEQLTPSDETDYLSVLINDAHGRPKPKSLANFQAVAGLHPRFKGTFCLNTFDQKIYVVRKPPWDQAVNGWQPRVFRDNDATEFAIWLERQLAMVATPSQALSAISSAAERRQFDPLRDYLDGLKWDGIPRVYGGGPDDQDGWLIHYAGATPSLYHRSIGMRWLIGAVARGLCEDPHGVKMDTMLVLEGAQGRRKSTLFRTLADASGQPMFTDAIRRLEGKETAQLLQGNWIVELGEMIALVSKEATDNAKAWMSAQDDEFRPPYARTPRKFLRRVAVGGTINRLAGRGYLKDATGARRFWPVEVGEIDIEGLKRDRDQLWAEAVHMYRRGEQWHLTPEEDAAAEMEQASRYQSDPWEGPISETVGDHVRRILKTKLFEALGLPPRDQTHYNDERLARIMARRGFSEDGPEYYREERH